MSEERARILELLRQGKITVDEAEQLLDALGPERDRPGPETAGAGGAAGRRRVFCVRITDTRTGRMRTNVRLPFGAWAFLSKLSRTKLGRHMSGLGLDLEEIQRAARQGATHLVDVTDEESGERVEVFFE